MKYFKLFALLATCSLLFVACNKDEAPEQKIQNTPTPDYAQRLTKASEQLSETFAQMDTQELKQLSDSLPEGSLKTLLEGMVDTFGGGSFHLGPDTFAKVSQLLAINWDVCEEGITIPYDGVNYTIRISSDTVDEVVVRTLTIDKDGEAYISISSYRVDGVFYGDVIVNGNTIKLSYERVTAHSRINTVTVIKAGSKTPLIEISTNLVDNLTLPNIINGEVVCYADVKIKLLNGGFIIDGHIKDVSVMLQDAVAMANINMNGATEEACSALADKFNENAIMTLSSSAAYLGEIYLCPVLKEDSENYTLAFLAFSSAFGDKPLNLNELFINLIKML